MSATLGATESAVRILLGDTNLGSAEIFSEPLRKIIIRKAQKLGAGIPLAERWTTLTATATGNTDDFLLDDVATGTYDINKSPPMIDAVLIVRRQGDGLILRQIPEIRLEYMKQSSTPPKGRPVYYSLKEVVQDINDPPNTNLVQVLTFRLWPRPNQTEVLDVLIRESTRTNYDSDLIIHMSDLLMRCLECEVAAEVFARLTDGAKDRLHLGAGAAAPWIAEAERMFSLEMERKSRQHRVAKIAPGVL
jgi:hypothetical protein